MPRLALALASRAVMVATVAAGAAAGAAKRRTFVSPAAVRELSASGTRAALLVGASNPCRALVTWSGSTGRAARVRSGCSGSARDATFGVAVAATRLGWVVVGGGNLMDMTVTTATFAQPRPKTVSFVGSGPDVDGDYVGEVVGSSGGGSGTLFFSEYRRCADVSEGETPTVPCPARERLGLGDPYAGLVVRARRGELPLPG